MSTIKVNALQDSDDISDAAESAQQLQQEWKRIGHAGKREESRLWAVFLKSFRFLTSHPPRM